MIQTMVAPRLKMGMLRDEQTYRNILYLLLSFFCGLCYFIILIPGILLGIGTLVIWIGVPLLFALGALWWQFASFERFLAMRWLHVNIAPMSAGTSKRAVWWQRFWEQVSERMTWKTLAYLLLKFPLGLLSFIVTVTLIPYSLAFGAAGLVLGLLTAPFFALIIAILSRPEPGKLLRRYILFSLTGFGLILLTLYLLNGLAFLAGQLARLLLGMSDTALRLEEARIRVEQEQARAEQAEQRRRELVVNVSHELRAPVASICGHLESLLLAIEDGSDPLAPALLRDYLGIAYQEAKRLGLLVDELLSLARMEADELHLDMQEVDAQEVIEGVYQTLMPLAQRERQVMLVRGAQPALPPVLADRQRLIQVLTNLVRNAITSTPAGGIVSLSLERTDAQHLALIVEDNGVGIPAEDLPRIFERFYRADTSRSRATGGFGLGLAIVHDLVTAMGGSITVESTPNQGSRFCVLLHCSTTLSTKPGKR